MSQVSKVKLDKELESELYKQFWYSLGKINNSQKSADFFSDILTDTERLMLAKRFAAAILIIRGKSPTEIRSTIRLAYSTIGSISSWIKNAKPATKNILESLSKEKNLDSIFDKIDEILEVIPPRRHSDWKEEYTKRNVERNKRFARKDLR